MTNETLIFQHIPKTGGITLSHLLLHHFDRNLIFHIRSPQHAKAPIFSDKYGTVEDFIALSEEERSRFHCVMGHMPFGIHEHIPGRARYICIFRDPVERVLSQHGQYNRMVQNREIGNGQLLSLEEYLREKPGTLENHQTRFLIANNFRGSDDEARFAQVQKILSEYFCVVGILERFEEAIVLLNKEMGWPCVPYIRRNVGSLRSAQAELSPDLLELMREKNHLDFKVHAFAEDLLEQAKASYGPGFQVDLANLHRANEALERSQSVRPNVIVRGMRFLKRLSGSPR